jgi:hypothetical protein
VLRLVVSAATRRCPGRRRSGGSVAAEESPARQSGVLVAPETSAALSIRARMVRWANLAECAWPASRITGDGAFGWNASGQVGRTVLLRDLPRDQWKA